MTTLLLPIIAICVIAVVFRAHFGALDYFTHNPEEDS